MNDPQGHLGDEGLANLAIDPDLLARELEAEMVGDPLDEIEWEDVDSDARHAARECELGLQWLKQGHEVIVSCLHLLSTKLVLVCEVIA